MFYNLFELNFTEIKGDEQEDPLPNDDPTIDNVSELPDEHLLTHEHIKINVTNELGEKVHING